MEFGIVELSRLQFALTAMYHFLFVPLTLGLSILVAIMETVYVMTNRPIWRQMTKFWGKLFLINFALGVVTGITLEFQFGTNWSQFSTATHGFFGNILGFEVAMDFMLEAGFLGIMVFGWNRVSPRVHLFSTCMVALGASLSAFWIMVDNSWMQIRPSWI